MRRVFIFFCAALAAAAPAAASPPSPIIVLEPDSAQLRQTENMIYVEESLRPPAAAEDELLADLTPERALESPLDFLFPMHHLYTELRQGLQRYRVRWGGLPEVEIPAGPTLRPGQSGERVALLRERLGLPPGLGYDSELAAAVREYQQAHGIGSDGIAGDATIASLNLGPEHYERVILLNLDRVRGLPPEEPGRYVLVDAAAAQLWLYEDGRPVDTMRVIVGNAEQPTPMMAASISYAEVNPYWNVPPDFVQRRIAPRILAEGTGYLRDRRYEVLADWTEQAEAIDPDGVDWIAVERGETEMRLRQLPGANNSMGEIKFMMPNPLGIYLHDTPDKSLFQQDARWISNGCVRVEDARRLARWMFGEMPHAEPRDRQQRIDLDRPVPVYITYLTAAPGPDGEVRFRADPYGRDDAATRAMIHARLD
ncbi:MAG TPA: L,D-transpeptidase family protein [Allosphingosinicella sp.]|jgi:murein L,D-transpeptidase YcbB/YkuD